MDNVFKLNLILKVFLFSFDALETVEKTIDQLDIEGETKTKLKGNMQVQIFFYIVVNVTRIIQSLKRFLKFDFKSSIEDQSSSCGFHCEEFALSQAKKSEYSEDCSCPDHTNICSGCTNQVQAFTSIRDNLVNMGDRWLLHKFEIAAKDVNEYKKHIVRAIHQDRAKADTMRKLSPHVALILFDYAMKFLPQKYREAQSDLFAKKGWK